MRPNQNGTFPGGTGAALSRHHRFGDLYRWLNRDVLRLCFLQLRKDAASGVDGVTYQEGDPISINGKLRTLLAR